MARPLRMQFISVLANATFIYEVESGVSSESSRVKMFASAWAAVLDSRIRDSEEDCASFAQTLSACFVKYAYRITIIDQMYPSSTSVDQYPAEIEHAQSSIESHGNLATKGFRDVLATSLCFPKSSPNPAKKTRKNMLDRSLQILIDGIVCMSTHGSKIILSNAETQPVNDSITHRPTVIYASKGSSELAVIYASKGSSELA
ncbi:hypothetical protein ACJX0J_029514, partial [Zea mays]